MHEYTCTTNSSYSNETVHSSYTLSHTCTHTHTHTQALSQLPPFNTTSFPDLVLKWRQDRLNTALMKACTLGNYKLAIPLIQAGANNYEKCIKNTHRLNHITAFLRLCLAAYDNDRDVIHHLMDWDEEDPADTSLIQYRHILLPLLDNGKLSVSVPVQVALQNNNVSAAADLLLGFSKHPSSGMVDWHGLDLRCLPSEWLKALNYPNLSLLCLSFNHLTEIPIEICRFKNLVKLQVASNMITTVPPEIFLLPFVEYIDLSYNQITSLPDDLHGRLSVELSNLNLSDNKLTTFPGYFDQCKLKHLDLSRNRLHEVPQSIFNLRLLEALNLNHNKEIRQIPCEIGGLRYLEVLSIEDLPYIYNVPLKPKGDPLKFLQTRFKSMQTVSHYDVVVIGFPQYESVMDNILSVLQSFDLKCTLLRFKNPSEFLHLHHIFQLPNALYVVPWDTHNKQPPNSLHRVLRHLSIYASESPIVVAACWKSYIHSHSELETEEIISQSLWKDLSDDIYLKHILLEGRDVTPGVSEKHSVLSFVSFISDLSQNVAVTMFVPHSYYSCYQNLQDVCEQYRINQKCLLLGEWDFWEMVRGMPTHDLSSFKELPDLVSFLKLKACILQIQCPEESEVHYVLDRQWFCEVLSNSVSRRGSSFIQKGSAVIHQEGLIDLLDFCSMQSQIPTALKYLLNRHGLTIALSNEKWLLPSMLRKDKEDHPLNPFQSEQIGIRRQYTFSLTPADFWGRLIAHLRINMEDLVRRVSDDASFSRITSPHRRANTLPRQGTVVDWAYWRRGIACWQNACNLVYSIEATESEDEPYREGFEMCVPNNKTGIRTMHLLTFIIDSLLKNWYPLIWPSVEIWVPCSYCIDHQSPGVPSVSFHGCLLAASKGVGVRCMQHMEAIVPTSHIIPDLIDEEVSSGMFLPPGMVKFNCEDKSTCISPAPTETVFKGTYKNQLVAIKPFPSPVPNRRGKDSTSRDATPLLQAWMEFEVLRLLQSAKCPFILDIVGFCPDPLCLVFPFAKWSSLNEVIQLKDLFIPHHVRIRMVYQLATALKVLHSYRVIHRNICLANLLVYSLSADDPVNIKLGGFSDACYGIFQGLAVGCYGTYSAPEMLQMAASEYDERVDMFSFGFVAYEIITRSKVNILTNTPLLTKVVDWKNKDRPSLAPIRSRAPYLSSLMNKCWNPDPSKRPYASQVVEQLEDPLHVLVRDVQAVHKQQELCEFFAASCRFTRVQDSFHTDLFVCSGQLTGQSNAYLTHFSLPGLNFNSVSQLPSEYVICMGCVGPQLWVSFYGKKVRVYSVDKHLEFVNEFTFDQHVVAMAASPISVYLGLEKGTLQVYDITDRNVPSDPTNFRVVCKDQEFKSIEPLEDCVMCATKNKIFRLHPDTLETEAEWVIKSEKEIRLIVMSEFGRDDNDTLWVSFRRLDRIQVLNALTGKTCYIVECSKLVGSKPTKVYVLSMQAVLDTVWVGLNTGHILVFAANASNPSLITYLKVHKSQTREILLLHPSYVGPTCVLSTHEMTHNTVFSLDNSKVNTLPLLREDRSSPDAVFVVSFGTGLEESYSEIDKHGGVVVPSEEDKELQESGLHVVIYKGMVQSRLRDIELTSKRPPIASSRRDIVESEIGGDAIYDTVPFYEISIEEDPYHTLQEETHQLPTPYLQIIPAENSTTSKDTKSKPTSPGKGGKKSNLTKLFKKSPKKTEEPQVLASKEPQSLTVKDVESSDNQSEEHDYYEIDTVQMIPRSQSYLQPRDVDSHSPDLRRSTLPARTDLDDSCNADGFDPYVRMDSVFKQRVLKSRQPVTKAKTKAHVPKAVGAGSQPAPAVSSRENKTKKASSKQKGKREKGHEDDDDDDDFELLESFLGHSPEIPKKLEKPVS